MLTNTCDSKTREYTGNRTSSLNRNYDSNVPSSHRFNNSINSSFEEVPETKDREVAILPKDGGKWEIACDYRNIDFYHRETKNLHKITEHSVEADPMWTEEKPKQFQKWVDGEWVDDVQDWIDNNVKLIRKSLMDSESWRYERYEREKRLGIEPTDNIQELDNYMETLRTFPDNLTEITEGLIWPTE